MIILNFWKLDYNTKKRIQERMEINNTYDNSKILINDLESEKDSDNNIEM